MLYILCSEVSIISIHKNVFLQIFFFASLIYKIYKMNKKLCLNVFVIIFFCKLINCEEENHHCSQNSANWCKNINEAKACNVRDQKL